ncbi:MAG: adenylate cyclase [Bacteroidetes bacterium 4572_114]|nr:MAG: adenylate cyclase [Bacteroidetes bacterium 4572_114]
MGILNIEIKARSKDHTGIRKKLKAENADFKGTDHQIDTYFRVENGRLKLREGNIENSLIHYQRENKKGPKQSNIILYNSKPGSSLKGLLTAALGVLTVVDKTREIYYIGNVKFHLDTVEGLGTFVEIEAIDKDGTIGRDQLLKQCDHYLQLFGISGKDLISNSYSDMMLSGESIDPKSKSV